MDPNYVSITLVPLSHVEPKPRDSDCTVSASLRGWLRAQRRGTGVMTLVAAHNVGSGHALA
jgi:hypothetical protein